MDIQVMCLQILMHCGVYNLYNYEFLGPIGSDGLVGMFFIFKSCVYFKWVILSFKLKVILSEHTWIILGIPGKKGPPGKFGW